MGAVTEKPSDAAVSGGFLYLQDSSRVIRLKTSRYGNTFFTQLLEFYPPAPQ